MSGSRLSGPRRPPQVRTAASDSPREEISTSAELSKIKNNLCANSWCAVSLFANTLAWMGVYYAQPAFAKIDDDGYASYILHSVAIETGATLSTLPINAMGYRAAGMSGPEIRNELIKDFIIGSVLLYQPVTDLFISMCDSGSFTDFTFEKYADPQFSLREIAASFAVLGVGFGLLSYGMDKLLSRLLPDPVAQAAEVEAANSAEDYPEAEFSAELAAKIAAEQSVEEATPLGQESPDEELVEEKTQKTYLGRVQDVMRSSEWGGFTVGLQFFTFYFMDAIFDVDWVSFEETMPSVLGSAAIMAASGFVIDSLPEFLQLLEIYCCSARKAVKENEENLLSANALEGIVIATANLDTPPSVTPVAAAGNRYRFLSHRPAKAIAIKKSNKEIQEKDDGQGYIPPAYHMSPTRI